MPDVVIVADSTTSLPEAMYERYDIIKVPYYVHLGSRSLRDTVDLSSSELGVYMGKLADSDDLPRSANPGPGDYVEAFTEAATRGSECLSLHMTSAGSGAYQAACIAQRMAAERLPGLRISVMDTRNVSMCHGWMALQAARAAISGESLEAIVALVKRMMTSAKMIQTADTLRYLYMGGRIGRASQLVGSLLHVKPLISMDDGVIVSLGVARSRTVAYRRMADLVQRAVGSGGAIRLALTHALARHEAEKLQHQVEQVVAPSEVLFCDLSPALMIHTGPGTVGLCYVPTSDSEW